MGTVHKFKRPPKNERQFLGYRPTPSSEMREQNSGRWQLSDWQKSLLVWSALLLFATVIWALDKAFGGT